MFLCTKSMIGKWTSAYESTLTFQLQNEWRVFDCITELHLKLSVEFHYRTFNTTCTSYTTQFENRQWKKEASMFKSFTGCKIRMSLNCMTFKISCDLYVTAYTGKKVPKFRSYLLPPSSRYNLKAALYFCLPLYMSLHLTVTQLS